jgi:DNA-binding CsgD family transcriptional regulator
MPPSGRRSSGFGRDQLDPVDAWSALDQLAARQRELLLLVARSLSNTEIADQLVLSAACIKSHINRMLSRLGLGTGVQIVVRLRVGAVIDTPGANHAFLRAAWADRQEDRIQEQHDEVGVIERPVLERL